MMQSTNAVAYLDAERTAISAKAHELRVLNELILAVLDTADERLVEDALGRQPDVQYYDAGDFFARRLEVVECLHTQVRALDGRPTAEGSILSAAYAAMRHSVRNDRPLLLQKGEASDDDRLLEHRFKTALSDPHISSPLKATIRAMYLKVRN
jgi:hypothetical protein